MSTRISPSRAVRQQTRPAVIERTLANLAGSLEQSLFAERIAHQPGLLQQLDPRLKLASCLLLLLAISLSRSLAVIAGLYLFTLALAWHSFIPVGFFIKRAWLFLPFFTLIIAVPAFFLTPGPTWVILPLGLRLTQTGLSTALFLLLRVGTSVSLVVLLVLTTPWNSVLKALGALRVPDAAVLILGMTYRYIYLLLHIASDMFLSRRSRILGRLDGRTERRVVAATAATLLDKSLQTSSEVYLAMQSRGFVSYPRTLDTFQMKRLDWICGAAALLIAGLAAWLGR